MKTAIASSSELIEIENTVHRLSINDDLDSLISGSMVKESKPNPDIFLLAAQSLKVQPSECIVIEDSMNGTIAAHRAGMACLGFQNSSSGQQDLSLAQHIVTSMHQVTISYLLKNFS